MHREFFTAEILKNKEIAKGIYELVLECPEEAKAAKAGQFISVYTGHPAMILPRPLSLCEVDPRAGTLRIIYRVDGEGTKHISKYEEFYYLQCLGPLGLPPDLEDKQDLEEIAIVGGGIGVAPLLELTKYLFEELSRAKISIYLGFRNKDDVILVEDFKRFTSNVVVTTGDGSYGIKGNVIDAMPQGSEFDQIYGCGPNAMMKALAEYSSERRTPCTVSMEARMACSVGACLACVVKVKDEKNDQGWMYKRVCSPGPIFFDADKIIWD